MKTKYKHKKEELIRILEHFNIKNYYIEYYYKIFGNIVLNFIYEGVEYSIYTDRNEIVINHKTLLDTHCLECGIDFFEMFKIILYCILSKKKLDLVYSFFEFK